MPPGFMTGLHNSPSRFKSAYFEKFPGFYDTGDAGKIDSDGYVWVMSRTDDVINTAGHRFSTASFEEVLSDVPEIAEVAVVGIKDSFKGQTPLGLCVLNSSAIRSGVTEAQVAQKAQALIREKIGAVASFSTNSLVVVNALPKTRSGKVLRSCIRAIANHEEFKVPSTIDNPEVLDQIAEVIRKHERI